MNFFYDKCCCYSLCSFYISRKLLPCRVCILQLNLSTCSWCKYFISFISTILTFVVLCDVFNVITCLLLAICSFTMS
ncbi:hypothetical protein CW304_27915 [Bacillus sp. UFRGS-B20]|nr:hypothetical protein CW304_27915 [Bacillus sp. UFRGS-B20]